MTGNWDTGKGLAPFPTSMVKPGRLKFWMNQATKGKLPALLASRHFRNFILVALMTYFTYGLIKADGDLLKIGLVFVRTILFTTLIAIGLGLKYQPRTWCNICPMGTLSQYAAQAKKGLAYKKKLPNRRKE